MEDVHDLEGARVLFVDDNQMLHDVLDRLLSRHGVEVESRSKAREALDVLDEEAFDLLITEAVLPDINGGDLLDRLSEAHPQLSVVMVTSQANVQHAVEMMKKGAADYIPKPFSTTEFVDRIKEHLVEDGSDDPTPQPEKVSSSEPATEGDSSLDRYVGEHPTIQNLKRLVPPVSKSEAPVFVHGESGTGKEILSRIVHEMSDRADGPYITVNCANLPRELVESHLFGHRKGAFTGAVEDREGAFEVADGGTLLLDEITEIDLSVQAKLLRVLQEQEFQRVGETTKRQIDVRVIATSNRDLREAVDEDIFREDLYHRLAVFPLHVPPLRERLSDVPLLAQHFVRKYCRMYDLPEKDIASDLMDKFMSYSWPGNVRQLENMIHRGVALATDRDVIELGDVFNEFISQQHTETDSTDRQVVVNGHDLTIDEMERRMILETLRETENQKQAAEKLGISARTIRNKLKRYREEGYSV